MAGRQRAHRKARRRLAVLEEQRILRLFGDRAAHYAGGYKTFGELASPIHHRLYRRSPDAPEASLRCIPSCPDRARPFYQKTHREAPSPLQPPAVNDGILTAVKGEKG
jgi:hypothetical protein